jgi:eukaryotic-like serine/threonine-protein kinase
MTTSTSPDGFAAGLVRFSCPMCRSTLEAELKLQNARISCPRCRHTSAVPSPSLPPGASIAGGRIIRFLGGGGMGEVYEILLADGRSGALKILKKGRAQAEDLLSFRTEAELSLRLNHPNVIHGWEYGDHDGQPFLISEVVQGRTVEDLLRRRTIIEEREALRLCLSVCEGMAYAWKEARIIHRDLKPANIMLTRGNVVKILDLGVGIRADQAEKEYLAIGTPPYMSPEQASKPKSIDHRSDIYSLGACLYEMITGIEPYQGTADEVINKVARQAPPPPEERRPGISNSISALICRFMARDRAKRPQSWEDAALEIRDLLEPKTAGSAPENVPASYTYVAAEDRGAFTWLWALALSALALLGLAWFFLVKSGLIK